MYRIAELPNSNNACSDDEGYDILKHSELHPVLHYSDHEQAPPERIQKPSMVDTSSDHPLRSASPNLISLENEDEAVSKDRQVQLTETMASHFPVSAAVSGSTVINSLPGSRSSSENEAHDSDSESLELQDPDQVLDELSDRLESHHLLEKLDESHHANSPDNAGTHEGPGMRHFRDINIHLQKIRQVIERHDKSMAGHNAAQKKNESEVRRSYQVPFLGIPDHADIAESLKDREWLRRREIVGSPLQSDESDTEPADPLPIQNFVCFEDQLDELEETASVASDPAGPYRGSGTFLLENRAETLLEWPEPSRDSPKKKPRKRRRKNGPEKAVPKPKESASSKKDIPVRPAADTPREKLAVEIYSMLAAGTTDSVHDFASLVETISQGLEQCLREMEDEEVHNTVAALFYASHPELDEPSSAEVTNSDSDIAHDYDEDPDVKETYCGRLGIAIVAQAILMLFLYIVMRIVPYLWVVIVNNIYCVWPDLHWPGLH